MFIQLAQEIWTRTSRGWLASMLTSVDTSVKHYIDFLIITTFLKISLFLHIANFKVK